MLVDDLSSYRDQAALILFEDVDGSIKSDYYPRSYLAPIIPYIESTCITTNTLTDITDISDATPVRRYRFRHFVDENTLLYQSLDLFNRELPSSNDLEEEEVSCLVEDGYFKYTITNIPFFISRFTRRFDIETVDDVLDFIPFKLSSGIDEVTVTAETFIDNGIRFPTSETICQFKYYVKLKNQKEEMQKLRDIQKRGGMVFLCFEWRSKDFSKNLSNSIRQGGTAYVYLPYENYDYKNGDEIWGVRIRPKLCTDKKFRFYDSNTNVITTFNSRYGFVLGEPGVRSCTLTLTRR